MAGCAVCLHKNVHPNVCSDCLCGTHFKPRTKTKTNADRIRSMSDEELADFLCDISGGESCTYCVASDLCHNGHNGMIEWLKEGAKDD